MASALSAKESGMDALREYTAEVRAHCGAPLELSIKGTVLYPVDTVYAGNLLYPVEDGGRRAGAPS